jgi:hypothetical protein
MRFCAVSTVASRVLATCFRSVVMMAAEARFVVVDEDKDEDRETEL